MASFFMAALKSFQRSEVEPPKGTPKDGRAATLPSGVAHEEFEEYRQQLLEEKIERDKAFAQKKGGWATVWMHLQDKYHLAQDEWDSAQLHTASGMASGMVELPQDLVAMVHNKEEEENGSTGAFAFLTKLQEVDLTVLRDCALGSVDEVKEKCTLI